MDGIKAYMNFAKDVVPVTHVKTYQIKLDITQVDEVNAVWIDGISRYPLDPEFGAGIEIRIEDMDRWMADYRHTEYWCCPAFGSCLGDIPQETQGLLYQKKEGRFGVILPVVSEQYKCVLEGREDTVLAKLFSWYEGMTTCKGLAFLWAEGPNPYDLLKKCSKVGMKLLNNGCRVRDERRYPELFEYLGWCSWDAFQIRVDEKSLIAKCEEFQAKKIPVKWAIIDDMWAEVRDFYDVPYSNKLEMFGLMHCSKLYSFQADPRRFPRGLKHCIEKINEYGIKVGMWHPTTGYWVGIDPQGDIFRDHKECLIKTTGGLYIHSPQQEKAYQFYHSFHEYLRQSGAEFVKIDNQSMTRRFYKNMAPVGQVARQIHNAMEASVGQHFDNQMINCMGMGSEDMWNRSVSPISRCSDDFQPEDRAWFAKHIMQCSYNCLVQGQFYYCDWDMWWTDDGQAVKNSILRAISGGPIYISDTLDRSRAQILWPLILSDGRILRCDRPAMPSIDCLLENPLISKSVFKLQNICNGSGIIAAFNLDEENKAVDGSISPSDVDGLKGEVFGVFEHFTRAFYIVKKDESFAIQLRDNDDFRLYVLVPLHEGCGMIGRIDKFISPKTVRYTSKGEPELVESGPYGYVKNNILMIVEEEENRQ